MVDQDRRLVLRTLGAVGTAAMFQAAANPVFAAAPSVLTEEGVFGLGAFALECGSVLPAAKIAYKTHGRLNREKGNAVLYPTQIGAQHGDIEWLIGLGPYGGRGSQPSRLEVHRR